MATINNNRFVETLARAMERVTLTPEHRYICLRDAHYHYFNWYIHFGLSTDDEVERSTHVINTRALGKPIQNAINDFYLPIVGIDEALALAHFSISNRKSISSAQLARVSSHASETQNVWQMSYHCMTHDDLFVMFKLQLDVKNGAIMNLHEQMLDKQES